MTNFGFELTDHDVGKLKATRNSGMLSAEKWCLLQNLMPEPLLTWTYDFGSFQVRNCSRFNVVRSIFGGGNIIERLRENVKNKL